MDFSHIRNNEDVKANSLSSRSDITARAQNAWGKAYNPDTNGVKTDVYVSETKEENSIFGQVLGEMLELNGIDPNTRIDLTTTKSGNVIVTSNHPEKEKIEQIFAENKSLTDAYHVVSNHNNAAAGYAAADMYHNEWQYSSSKEQRDNVHARYQQVFNSLDQGSRHMTYENGSLTSRTLKIIEA